MLHEGRLAHSAAALHPQTTPLPGRSQDLVARSKMSVARLERQREKWTRFVCTCVSSKALEIEIENPELGLREVTEKNRDEP
jgi:hypothetical protein